MSFYSIYYRSASQLNTLDKYIKKPNPQNPTNNIRIPEIIAFLRRAISSFISVLKINNIIDRAILAINTKIAPTIPNIYELSKIP